MHEWIGIGLTCLAMTAGSVIWVQSQLKELRKESETKLQTCKEELTSDLDREERLREEAIARVERQIEGFAQVASAVIAMGKSVEHLTEKFGDSQRHNDRAMDEVKHSIRNIEQKMVAHQAASRRSAGSRARQPQ